MQRWQRAGGPWAAVRALALVGVCGCGTLPQVGTRCSSDVECGDGEPCTRNVCDEGVCVYLPDDALVPDQASDSDCRRDVCRDGRQEWEPDDSEVPDDGVPCTVDRCVDGEPVFTPVDEACGPGGPCRLLVCDPFGAQGIPDADGCVALADGTAPPDDGAACTLDTCVGSTPVYTPRHELCEAPGGGPACLTAVCDPEASTAGDGSGCALTLSDEACDDGDPCTVDLCDPEAGDPVTGCRHEPLPSGAVPTQIPGNCQVELCNAGVPSSAPDDLDVPIADGDGVACTVPACSGGAPVEVPDDGRCDDGLACTLDLCDPIAGCLAVPQHHQCSGGEGCDPEADPTENPSGCIGADTCPPVLQVFAGHAAAGDTAGLADDFTPSCAQGGHPDLAFRWSPAATVDATLTVTALGREVAVALVQISGLTCGGELACAAGAGGASASLVNVPAGTYAVVVDGGGAVPSEGAFELTVTEAPSSLGPGSLVISEVMSDPAVVSDANGEYLEIANPGGVPVVLGGITLSEDSGETAFALAAAGGGLVVVPAGGFVVGTQNLDPAANGGIDAHFKLPVSLNNTPNEHLVLARDGLVIDELDLDGFGPTGAGRSRQLDAALLDAASNDLPRSWCLSTDTFGAGDLGSPGLPNARCGAPCGADHECEDGNPCTHDACWEDFCLSVPSFGIPDDGLACTIDMCVAGEAVNVPDHGVCDDGVSCTEDLCVGAGGDGAGCASEPRDDLCAPSWLCDPVLDCFDPGLPGDVCLTALPLAAGATVDSTAGAADDVDLSCGEGGPDWFFTFTLQAPSTVSLALTPASGVDLAVALFDGSCEAPRELACADEAGIDALEILGLEAGTYLVAVDAGASGAQGDFTLEATFTEEGVPAGALVINELLINPEGTDTDKEWVELANPHSFHVATGTLVFGGTTGGSAVRDSDGRQLVVGPGQLLLGARRADPSLNGGLFPAFTFTKSLVNSTDTLQVRGPDGIIDELAYSSGSAGFPTVASGQAYNLDPGAMSASLNDLGASWCNATPAIGATTYDGGNYGTPGAPNLACAP